MPSAGGLGLLEAFSSTKSGSTPAVRRVVVVGAPQSGRSSVCAALSGSNVREWACVGPHCVHRILISGHVVDLWEAGYDDFEQFHAIFTPPVESHAEGHGAAGGNQKDGAAGEQGRELSVPAAAADTKRPILVVVATLCDSVAFRKAKAALQSDAYTGGAKLCIATFEDKTLDHEVGARQLEAICGDTRVPVHCVDTTRPDFTRTAQGLVEGLLRA